MNLFQCDLTPLSKTVNWLKIPHYKKKISKIHAKSLPIIVSVEGSDHVS
jgi:hypothetical protein